MAKRGPAPKPADQREAKPRRARKSDAGAELVLLEQPDRVVPDPPAGLSAESLKRWDAFWRSELVITVREVDWPAIARLFRYYEQWEIFMGLAETDPMATGSMGQTVDNPAAGEAARLEGLIRSLESDLGLTPMARLKLGLTMAQGQLTAEHINRMAKERRGETKRRRKTDSEDEAVLAEWQEAE